MRAFAEQEIVLPDGPFKGQAFRIERQPFAALWFDAVDSGRWNRFVCTGPTQTGKTLIAFVVPILYHLFEVGETVICAVPKMDMAGDKWREDILPAIQASKYRDLLPTAGGGSKGGKVTAIRFKNGATLRFMSGGGDDKSRAGFTARVLVITETDGMDEAGGTSREADKITQLEARTRAYGDRKRIYMECTVSTTTGRTWTEYSKRSTGSRIVVRCPHCKTFIGPERDHLTGWQEAETEGQAKRDSWYFCPQCGEKFDEADRRRAHADMRLLHGGQEIDADGQVKGDLPDTDTLGFRWNAFNNFFVGAGVVGQDEWRAARAIDEDNARKEINQFVWAWPWDPDDFELIELDPLQVKRRLGPNRKGVVPDGTTHVVLGLDMGQDKSWWVAIACRDNMRRHILDYGCITAEKAKEIGVEQSVYNTLQNFQTLALYGWPTTSGEIVQPAQAWIDAGWKKDVIYAFCKQAGGVFTPIHGLGQGQHMARAYRKPGKKTRAVRMLGEEYHMIRRDSQWVMEVNSDHWKTRMREGLAADVDAAGAITFYESADANEHDLISRHQTAEKPVEKARPGKPPLLVWERLRRANHYGDATVYALAAGHYVEMTARKQAEREAAGGDWWGAQNKGRGR